ncbi:hypothetical protein Taro_003966 [Colocasia esculenta]|uniref:Retrotransposon gag domain-containing protein n=1 Tax=Colocasia esculenta TaxID=4460 RepID=A0A843TQC2_COLES|nr:hypothetical protein [Colocasia esculenta]
MASRGRRGRAPAREDEPRREERAEQQAPAPQGPILPPPPPGCTPGTVGGPGSSTSLGPWWTFHHGVIQEDATTLFQGGERSTVGRKLDEGDRKDLPSHQASLLRTRFEDGAIDVAWDEFVRLFRAKFVPEHIQDRMEQEFLSLAQGSMTVLEYEARFFELSKYAPLIVADECRKTKKFVMGLKPSLRTRLVVFDHRTLDEALSAACRQEGEMEQYLEEKKASQKRPAATFQWQDKKKVVYQT